MPQNVVAHPPRCFSRVDTVANPHWLTVSIFQSEITPTVHFLSTSFLFRSFFFKLTLLFSLEREIILVKRNLLPKDLLNIPNEIRQVERENLATGMFVAGS